jgi:tetratricopeptide (TPR) repeat protein
MSPPRTAPGPNLLKAAVILAVGAWIYAPALHGPWIWDDSAEIAQNPLMGDPHGLAKIWISPVTPDFFPLKTTLQWLLWRLWGASPAPYHVLTLGLHLASALLFWQVLKKLGLRAAWLGGLLLVVHPMTVESVAWVAELKNTLSLAFLLGAMIAYLDYDAGNRGEIAAAAKPAADAGLSYALALMLFVLASLSKSSVVMFPFVVLLHAWWKRGRLQRRDWVGSIPFFAVSLILGLVTVYFQQHRALASWSIPIGGWNSRIAAAGVALAFYFWKCLWPLHLLLMYPQWSVNPPTLVQFLPWPLLALLLGWFWLKRATWGRPALFGVGFFVLNLLPVLGFVSMAYLHIAWVADHFAYLPLLGLLGLGAGAAGRAESWLASRPAAWRAGAIGGLVLLLGALAGESRHQASLFGDEEALWAATLRENPGAWMAHINLGQFLGRTGRGERGLAEYSAALRIRTDLPEAYYNRASTLEQLGRFPEAIQDFEQALRLEPANPDAQVNLGNTLLRSGRLEEAIGHYQAALTLQPEAADARTYLAEARYSLGYSLMQRHQLPAAAAQFAQAVGEFRAALALRPDNAEAHAHFGNILLLTHHLPDAVAQYEEALRLRPDDAATRQNLALARGAMGGGP